MVLKHTRIMATERQREAREERKRIREGREKERMALNRIWLWTGVTALAVILLHRIFAIGTFEVPNQ